MDAPSVGGSGLSDEVDEESPRATATKPLVHPCLSITVLKFVPSSVKADPPLPSYLQVSPQLARGGCHSFPFLFIAYFIYLFMYIYLFTFYLYFQSSRRKPTMTRRWRW
jgi:hypothetical protein